MISKERRTLLFFYLLAFYIFCQIIWWGYSLLTLHLKIISQSDPSSDSETSSRIYMVLGEGVVFLVIFIFGIWKIQNNLRKDFQHARTEKTFLLSVTHELKTPVAILRLMLETLRKKELEKSKQTEIISGALDETDRLQNLVENILFVTRLNQGRPALHPEQLYLSSVVDSTVDRYHDQSLSRLVKEIKSPGSMLGDQQTLQILLSNLIDNALKYSSPDGKVVIRLFNEGNNVVLSVGDNGPGIPPEERKNVLKKFYRIGNEETRKHKGTGLGLYLVARITELNNGKISISDNPPNGTLISIVFPRTT